MSKSPRWTEPSTPCDSGSTPPKKATGRRSAAQNPPRVAREQPISVRFEPAMIERLDRVATQLSKVNLNIRIGRSSVVKLAMDRALAALEAELSIVGPDDTRQLR